MARKFKVGDVVIGLESAKRYGITNEGFVGKVKENLSDKRISIVRYEKTGSHDGPFPVLEECFALYDPVAKKILEERPKKVLDIFSMTNAEMYEAIFGVPHAGCPTGNCSDCPGHNDCKRAGKWWDSPCEINLKALTPRRPKTPNTEHTPTKKKGLEGLCEEYNYSDSAGLEFIENNNLCTTPEQKNTLYLLVLLNELIYTYGSDKHSESEYRIKYVELLRSLEITIDKEGYAKVKGGKK